MSLMLSNLGDGSDSPDAALPLLIGAIALIVVCAYLQVSARRNNVHNNVKALAVSPNYTVARGGGFGPCTRCSPLPCFALCCCLFIADILDERRARVLRLPDGRAGQRDGGGHAALPLAPRFSALLSARHADISTTHC